MGTNTVLVLLMLASPGPGTKEWKNVRMKKEAEFTNYCDNKYCM